jgi:hypothetical protein
LALKRFVKGRSEKAELIGELRDVLVGGSSKRGMGLVEGGPEECLRFLLSLGNGAYRSGDSDVFQCFLGAVFDVVDAGAEGVDCGGLVDFVRGYGFRSVRDFDQGMFGAVVEVLVDRVSGMRDVGEIDGWLVFLGDMGLRSAEVGFEGGVLAAVGGFGVLGAHFDAEGLGVSAVSLRNRVVGLVHYLGGLGDDGLRGRVISLVEGVLVPPGGVDVPAEGVPAESPPVA